MRYTIVYTPQRYHDDILAVLIGDLQNQIQGAKIFSVEAETVGQAITKCREELNNRRTKVLPWITLDRIFEKTRAEGIDDSDVAYWLVSPNTYWEEQDAPYNHFDDSEGMIKSAMMHFDRTW